MATYTSIIQLKGIIGDMAFRTQGETKVAYRRPHFSKERWLHDSRFRNCRQNAMEFGGASKCAAALYRQFVRPHKKWMRPLAHNAIASALRTCHPRHGRKASAFTFLDNHRSLIGLELSHPDSIGKKLGFSLVGPNHAPDHCEIKDLREIATTLDPHALLGLQCRIIRRKVNFVDCHFDPDGRNWTSDQDETAPTDSDFDSGWFEADLLPEGPVKVSLGTPAHFRLPNAATQDRQPMLAIIFVQWRTTKGPKPRPLYKQATVRIIAAIMPLELAQELAKLAPLTPRNRRKSNQEQMPINPDISKAMLATTILGSPPP